MKRDWSEEPWNHWNEIDRQRAYACVNACAGIPTEALANGVLGEVQEVLKVLTAQVPSVESGYQVSTGNPIFTCYYCYAKYDWDGNTRHKEHCAWARARDLLSKLRGGE